MAAVTVNRQDYRVQGDLRVILANIDIAADEDTFVTGLRDIRYFHARSVTNNAIGGTSSAGTITFQTAGAETGVEVRAEGY